MNIKEQVSLNLNIRGMAQSPAIAINEKSKKLRETGKTIYCIGLGQSPFPVPVVETLKTNAHQKDYLSAEGLPSLRKAVSKFHRQKTGVESSKDNVLIMPGSKELMFLLQLDYYGELIVPTPCCVSYIPQANIIGRKVVLVPTKFEDRWKITSEMLERYCADEADDFRPRIMILNYPANPDGCTYAEDQLRELAEVARKYKFDSSVG